MQNPEMQLHNIKIGMLENSVNTKVVSNVLTCGFQKLLLVKRILKKKMNGLNKILK